VRRPCAAFCFGLTAFTAIVLSLAEARAESTAPGAAPDARSTVAPASKEAPASRSRGGVYALVGAGYGASTNDVGRLEVAPYAAMFSLNLGYAWRSGFHFGVYGAYGLGSAVTQTYEPRIGESYEVTADASSVHVGLSVGFDVPLDRLLLRYSLGLGASFMSWDFGEQEPNLVEFYSLESPSSGVHVMPGLALILPLGSFQCGIGVDYFVQANDGIPYGFVTSALFGVKL